MQSFDVRKHFGTSVRAWRTRLGISQEELGGRAGLHRTYICDVERGARNVTLQSIEKLAGALEISPATLLASATQRAALQGSQGAPLMPDELVDILYIDDDPADVELAIAGLKRISNRIHVVRDGLEALDFLFNPVEPGQRRGRFRPQLILLDLGLPKMDGLEVLRRIKADPRTASIPVVVVTASTRDRDLQASKQLGAVTYIIKPLSMHNLSKLAPKLDFHWALMKPMPPLPPRPQG